MRRAVFAAVFAAGLVAIVISLVATSDDAGFTVGTLPGVVAARLAPGRTACQRSVPVPSTGGFRDVTTLTQGGGEVAAEVRSPGGAVRRGRGDATAPVRLDGDVPGGGLIDVCLTNAGARPLALVGGSLGASPLTYATVGARRLPNDLVLGFDCGCRRSGLARVVDEIRDARYYKLAGPGALYEVLFALFLLVGLPALAWLALGRRAPRD